jgi:glycolate oxidase
MVAALRASVRGRVIDDPGALQNYRHDEALTVASGTPAAAVIARSRDDVVATLDVARSHGAPVVPRGAGSGLSGGANAVDGGIVLCLEEMNAIVEIHRGDLVAVVQPGVINAALRSAAAEVGLFYAPDPGSMGFSTLGGNIATNAGGLCCAKYGVTRDWVLGLEVVLADGSVLRSGRRTLKGVAGYDLTSLFVGSEGTLGVITEATLRLSPHPPTPTTMIASFADLGSAGRAIHAIRTTLVPSMLELMDQMTLSAIQAWRPLGLEPNTAALLVGQSDAGDVRGAGEAKAMADLCHVAGATHATIAANEVESDYFVDMRRMAYPALQRLGSVLLDDVCVPCDATPVLLTGIEEIARRTATQIATFGHAADGNMHPTVIFDAAHQASTARAGAAFSEIVALALALGGTITGEHGVGLLKRELLREELSEPSMAVQSKLRSLFDPTGVLNPGKVL